MLILGLKGLTRFDCNIFKRRLKLTNNNNNNLILILRAFHDNNDQVRIT